MDIQRNKLDAIFNEAREKMRDSFGGNPQDFQNLRQEERAKKFQEIGQKMAQIQKENEEKVSKILEPKQMDRLKQLGLEVDGAQALSRPEVSQQLGLTPEQQQKIRSSTDLSA